jgi:hypothetical protein
MPRRHLRHVLTASVGEPDLRDSRRAHIGISGSGSPTLAVRKRLGHTDAGVMIRRSPYDLPASSPDAYTCGSLVTPGRFLKAGEHQSEPEHSQPNSSPDERAGPVKP